MTEVTLIRHGQANSGARTEADDDCLLPPGRQQAEWLGLHLRDCGGFDRVISGTVRRQVETAEALNAGRRPHHRDARLNELDCFGRSHAIHAERGGTCPGGPAAAVWPRTRAEAERCEFTGAAPAFRPAPACAG